VYYCTQSHKYAIQYDYFTEEDIENVTEHIVYISGLEASTTYHFRAMSSRTNEDGLFVTAISDDCTFTTESEEQAVGSSGGGGGGGGGSSADRVFVSSAQSQTGIFDQNASVSSSDGNLFIYIESGTIYRDADYKLANYITTRTYESNKFGIPEKGAVIGFVYDLGPDGATFSKPVTLGLNYSANALPPGIDERDLGIGYWNYTKKRWIQLDDCTVDTQNKIIYGAVDHFTPYTVIYQPLPQNFRIEDIAAAPEMPRTGQIMTFTADVSNSGYQSGEYAVTLSIDDVTIETHVIEISPGSSVEVDFDWTAALPGSHIADINGEKTVFEVIDPQESKPEPFLVKSLKIEPGSIMMGDNVRIKALAVNPNESELDCRINLKINDRLVESRVFTLAGLSSEAVTFETACYLPGTYRVELEGLADILEVSGYPLITDTAPDDAIVSGTFDSRNNLNWIVVITAAAVILAVTLAFSIKKRK